MSSPRRSEPIERLLRMEDELWSKAFEVRDRHAADAMCHPFRRHLVLSLMGREASISELVSESRRPMSSVHYHMTRLHKLGLLKVASQTARAGRAVKRYTAAAECFFVPAALMGEQPGTLLDRELQGHLSRISDDSEGTLFFRDSRSGMSMRTIRSRRSREADHRLITDSWQILNLDLREAHELSDEIAKLLERYRQQPADRRRKKYLIRCTIVRRDMDELFAP